MESNDRVVYLTEEYKSIIHVVDGVQVQFTSSISLGQRHGFLIGEAEVYVAHVFEVDIVDDSNHVDRLVIEVYLVLAHARASNMPQFELLAPR